MMLFGFGAALSAFLAAYLLVTHRYTQRVEKLVLQRTDELTRANERLRDLGRLKDEFVSVVSHELRTPLAVMREGISQLREGLCGGLSAPQQETLAVILRNADRLGDLIGDLLDIAKIEAGKLELQLKEVDLAVLVTEACAIFRPMVQEKGLELKVKVPAGNRMRVRADSEKLSRVLINLVGNAVKFTERGFIEVAVKEDGREGLLCAVSDSGPGIAEENLPKLFQKFQQFSRSQKPGMKGTGLGLAICKGIVELHGGTIWAESRPNQGSRFCFRLPCPAEEVFHAA